MGDLTPLLGLGRLQWLEVLGVPLSQNAHENHLTVSILYRVSVVPTVYLIDAQGKIQDSAHGLPDSWNMLRRVTG